MTEFQKRFAIPVMALIFLATLFSALTKPASAVRLNSQIVLGVPISFQEQYPSVPASNVPLTVIDGKIGHQPVYTELVARGGSALPRMASRLLAPLTNGSRIPVGQALRYVGLAANYSAFVQPEQDRIDSGVMVGGAMKRARRGTHRCSLFSHANGIIATSRPLPVEYQ